MSSSANLGDVCTKPAKKWQRSLSLRITALLIVATFLLIGQSLYNLSSIEGVDDSIDIVNKAAFDLDNLSRNIKTPVAEIRILSMEMVSAPNRERLDHSRTRFDIVIETVEINLAEWEDALTTSAATSKEQKDAFSNILSSWKDYKAAAAKTFFYIDSGVRVAAFISLTEQEKESYDRLLESLIVYSRILVERSKEVFDSAKNQSDFAFSSLIVTSVIQVLILFLTLIFVYRMFKTYMRASQTYEREIEAKESQLRMAMDNMPGAMAVVNKDLELILLNDQYMEFYGNSDGLTTAGASMRDILRKEIELGYISGEGSPEEILEKRLESFRSKETHIIQDTTKGGRTIQITRKQTPDGHSVSVATDISEIIEARRGEKLLKEALDIFSDMIILYDQDEQVIFTNNRYHEIYPAAPPKAEITNYTMEALLRRSLESGFIDHPLARTDPEAWLQQALSARRDKNGSSGETTHKNGRTYFFRNNWTTEGGMILVQIDITDRKEADRNVMEKEKLLRAALENMSSGMFMFDKNDKIVLLNEQYTRLYDFPEGLVEIGGSPKTILKYQAERGDFGDGDANVLADQIMESLSDGQKKSYERQLFNGQTVEINIAPTPDGSTVAIYNDITERKKAERTIAEAMHLIHESIQYASRIQRSVLPSTLSLQASFLDHFVIWDPRDVVGGDIYWCRNWGGGVLLILGDCTGHGVPGAFMTLISTGALDRALIEVPVASISGLVRRMHQLVQTTLGQNGDEAESDDGLELGVCYINSKNSTLTFVGARFDLFEVQGEEVKRYKGDKKGIGYSEIPQKQDFTEICVDIAPSSVFYMTTDGAVDQIGDVTERGFGKRRFKTLLRDIQNLPMNEQKETIHDEIVRYQGDGPRLDDIAVIGFKTMPISNSKMPDVIQDRSIPAIQQIQDSLDGQGIFFCYSGYLSEDMLASMGSTLQRKMKLMKTDRSTARAIFAVFIEEAQNIIRYSSDVLSDEGATSNELRRGFIAIGNDGEQHFVSCGNLIIQSNVERLQGHLSHLSKMNQDQLKQIYKEVLKGEVPDGSKGAGVGFIDIARRSKNGIEFDFIKVDNDYSYFFLKACI